MSGDGGQRRGGFLRRPRLNVAVEFDLENPSPL
jgi:hypothetical protein